MGGQDAGFARHLRRSTEHGRASTARSHRAGEGRQGIAPLLRAKDGCARPDGADGEPDAELLRRGAGADEIRLQADQARRRRPAQGAVVAGRDAAQSAFRRRHQGPGRLAHLLRAARRLGPGRRPVRRCWPPRSRAARTAGSPPTACPSPGSSSGACSGTTASRSPPTMSSSTGNTPPIRPPPR